MHAAAGRSGPVRSAHSVLFLNSFRSCFTSEAFLELLFSFLLFSLALISSLVLLVGLVLCLSPVFGKFLTPFGVFF